MSLQTIRLIYATSKVMFLLFISQEIPADGLGGASDLGKILVDASVKVERRQMGEMFWVLWLHPISNFYP